MKDELINKAFELVDNGDVVKLKEIVNKNPYLINSESIYGSLLQEAVNEENEDMVIFLINNGADINYIGGLAGTSILTDAVNNGNLRIVQLLIESGVELTAKTFEANSLFAAIYKRHNEIAKYLIDMGIDTTAKYNIGEIKNCDAMEYAKQYGCTEIYNYLKAKSEK